MQRFRPAAYMPVPISRSLGIDWWTASGRASLLTEGRPEHGRSAGSTRETCACKMLGQGGCSTPQESVPVSDGYAPQVAGASQGPSTIAVIGAVGVVGVLGLLVAGVL